MNALADIAALLGEAHCLRTPQATARYLVDERQFYHGRAAAVVRPGTREELQQVVRICHRARIAMVPQGGNTGYCGGATPDASGSEVVISLERLNRVIEVDARSATITLEAGVVLATAQAAAASHNRLLPLSMGSQGSCQIGGNLATNAGGLAVLRYGTARDLTLGLEVVLADGTVLSDLVGLRKNNTGFDLRGLFVGAEGTLGIIAAATLKLFPLPPMYHTAWVAVTSVAAACGLLAELRDCVGDDVTSFEYISDDALGFALGEIEQLQSPFSVAYPHYVLIECCAYGAGIDSGEYFSAALGRGLENGTVLDAVVAHSGAQRRELWRLRENIPAAEKLLGGSLKHDVSVQIAAVPDYIERTRHALAERWSGLRLSVYGHVGDGNVHFNVLAPTDCDAAAFKLRHGDAISDVIHDEACRMGGSFSAEHGIGVLKRELLRRYTDPTRLQLMRSIKTMLDPQGLMNPGKVF